MPYDYGMTGTRRAQDADKFIVRFPDGMRDRIADAAKAANRTMNAEIVARLQASFESATSSGTQPADPGVIQKLASIDAQLGTLLAGQERSATTGAEVLGALRRLLHQAPAE